MGNQYRGVFKRYLQNFDIFIFWGFIRVKSPNFGIFLAKNDKILTLNPHKINKNKNIEILQITFV